MEENLFCFYFKDWNLCTYSLSKLGAFKSIKAQNQINMKKIRLLLIYHAHMFYNAVEAFHFSKCKQHIVNIITASLVNKKIDSL